MKIKYLFIGILILVFFLFSYTNTTEQKVYDIDKIKIESSLLKYEETPKIILKQDTVLKIKKFNKKELAQIKEDKNIIRQHQIDEKLYKLEEQRIILDSLLKITNDTIK